MANDQITKGSAAIGQALAAVPLRDMFGGLARSIADAQARLDEKSIELTHLLAATTKTLRDAEGGHRTYSLLELGLAPHFYHFSQARLELSTVLSMRTEQAQVFSFGLDVGASYSSTDSQATQATN
jgi:hypothetical protein